MEMYKDTKSNESPISEKSNKTTEGCEKVDDSSKEVALPHPEPVFKNRKQVQKKVPFEKISKHKRRAIKRQISTQTKQWVFAVAKKFDPIICAVAVALFAVIVALLFSLATLLSRCNPIPIVGNFSLDSGWTGVYEINNTLWNVHRMHDNKIQPANCLSIDDKGNLYVGMFGGVIAKLAVGETGVGRGQKSLLAHGPLEEAETGFLFSPPGYPIAMHTYDIMGLTMVLDRHYGLYGLHHKSGNRFQFVSLVNKTTGTIVAPMDMAIPDLDAAVYIVDMSTKWPRNKMMSQILEGTCTGRLIKYDMGSSKTTVVLNDLCAPVGAEFINHDQYIVIAEAGRSRLRIVDMNSTKTTQFIKLPGLPAKLSKGQRHDVWVPMAAISENFFKLLNPRPWLRKVLSWILPNDYLLRLATTEHTIAAELGSDFKIQVSLHDFGNRRLHDVNGILETKEEHLLFYSEKADFIGVLGVYAENY